MGASRLAQLATASRPLAVSLRAERRACPAQRCPAAHSRFATLHLGASRLAPLATVSRPLAVSRRTERRAWCRSAVSPQHEPSPESDVCACACECACASTRLRVCVRARVRVRSCVRACAFARARARVCSCACARARARPLKVVPCQPRSPFPWADGRRLRPTLVEPAMPWGRRGSARWRGHHRAARRPPAASRHSISEHRALHSSPLRCGLWSSCFVQSVAPGSARVNPWGGETLRVNS
jgi:hypothetical protein